MGMIDSISGFFKMHSDDDLEDDYDEYDDEFDEEYEEERPSLRKKLFSGAAKRDEEEEDGTASYSVVEKPKYAPKPKAVVPMANAKRGLEVVVIKPESMEDAKEITDTLLTGKAVVLNLEGIEVYLAQRIIDYSAGSTYSIRGNLQRITNYIFLVTPPNVDISGDFQDIVAGGIDLASFKNDANR